MSVRVLDGLATRPLAELGFQCSKLQLVVPSWRFAARVFSVIRWVKIPLPSKLSELVGQQTLAVSLFVFCFRSLVHTHFPAPCVRRHVACRIGRLFLGVYCAAFGAERGTGFRTPLAATSGVALSSPHKKKATVRTRSRPSRPCREVEVAHLSASRALGRYAHARVDVSVPVRCYVRVCEVILAICYVDMLQSTMNQTCWPCRSVVFKTIFLPRPCLDSSPLVALDGLPETKPYRSVVKCSQSTDWACWGIRRRGSTCRHEARKHRLGADAWHHFH